jgi:hypothetical protein
VLPLHFALLAPSTLLAPPATATAGVSVRNGWRGVVVDLVVVAGRRGVHRTARCVRAITVPGGVWGRDGRHLIERIWWSKHLRRTRRGRWLIRGARRWRRGLPGNGTEPHEVCPVLTVCRWRRCWCLAGRFGLRRWPRCRTHGLVYEQCRFGMREIPIVVDCPLVVNASPVLLLLR